MSDLERYIRNVPDFPKKGIGFKDITTLLIDADAFRRSVDELAEHYADIALDKVVGTEARGFIFGAALAYKMNLGFIPVRKPDKLPAETIREEYELEYGTDGMEIHKDAISPQDKILLVDDLLATGGTAQATARLVERLGGKIAGVAFLIELTFLHGREKLPHYEVYSLIKYDGE